MFTKAKGIDTAFRHVRLFTFLIVAASFGFSGYAVYKGYALAEDSRDKVYILTEGSILEAYASSRQENIPAEARSHVAIFHRLFFTLDPDEKAIQSGVGKALYLADASAKLQYDYLKESGYYTQMISGNVSQLIEVDSVALSTVDYPYYFRCTARQRIIRTTSIVTRLLITEGYLRTVSRSDNNPHGFLIERWKTLENRDLQVKKR